MTVQTFDDVAFLKTPEKWPNYPLCPVKNRNEQKDNFPLLGVIVSPRPTVYLVNLFSIQPGMEPPETREYGSFEELIADGWIVD